MDVLVFVLLGSVCEPASKQPIWCYYICTIRIAPFRCFHTADTLMF